MIPNNILKGMNSVKLIKVIEYPIFPILITSLLFGIIAEISTPVIAQESSIMLIESIVKSMVISMILGAFFAWVFIKVKQRIHCNTKPH